MGMGMGMGIKSHVQGVRYGAGITYAAERTG